MVIKSRCVPTNILKHLRIGFPCVYYVKGKGNMDIWKLSMHVYQFVRWCHLRNYTDTFNLDYVIPQFWKIPLPDFWGFSGKLLLLLFVWNLLIYPVYTSTFNPERNRFRSHASVYTTPTNPDQRFQPD